MPEPQVLTNRTQDGTHYTFLKWDEGSAIMLVDWCDGHHISGSSGSFEFDQRKGDAQTWDENANEWKLEYKWQPETADGLTATFTINDVDYDLSEGAVFRIDASGEETVITQVDRDLSKIPPDRNGCDYFVATTVELKQPTKSVGGN
ncbi:hypothetical protein NG895_02355 [Aeoliella sp. ICT_H6.2]|uniref:Uncharacterized protein n=1 Tax=Aeoliella straminimaris TaxID=2954799 RepID=A0A9X2FAJ7_9BACT|nr:hypothetical protein [Aeoliella straminimaris]MCO6042739.1 hypothetical protein [Aeoliella straminimaris]